MALALCAIAINTEASAATAPALSRAVQQGYDNGFRDCAAAMDVLVKFVHPDDDSYAHYGRWAAEKTNGETFTTLTSENFTDGKGITSFAATKNANGKCSVTFTQMLLTPDTICKTLREGSFKEWKEYADLNGDKIYEDPTTPNASVLLTPIGQTGCVILKQVVSFGIDPSPPKK